MTKYTAFTLILLSTLVHDSIGYSQEDGDWKNAWALEDYFSIEIDTTGYSFPSSIAFVPNPGNGPKDPLYYVTELRGKLKVITNDRTVYTFAENFFTQQVIEELPSIKGEIGMAGMCLEPINGYVFVTFSYNDENGILRNNIARFETKPEVFSVKPSSMIDFRSVFLSDQSANAHQIGPCQINDDLLYVSVGDGHTSYNSQYLDSTLGKIIRMTLDGKPSEQNPFYTKDGIDSARDYVWAYGFRNPFSLKIVKDRVFVADNGMSNDRFLEVHEGQNYFWDGTDWSIATNSDVVFSPAVGPVQMDYYHEQLDIFPAEFRERFYLALAGKTQIQGPSKQGGKSIVMLDYSFEQNNMNAPPKYFLKYRGDGLQLVVGLGFGPDGLYFSPIYPDSNGQSHVLKIQYDSTNSYPQKISEESIPRLLIAEKGCLGCHKLDGVGGVMGPNLERNGLWKRLEQRLNSPEYLNTLYELDNLDIEPYVNYKDARHEVLNAEGSERVRVWIKHQLMEPKFDNPDSQMPNMGLTETQALILTNLLLEKPKGESRRVYYKFFKSYIPELKYRYLVYSLFFGFFLSAAFFLVLYLLFLRRGKIK